MKSMSKDGRREKKDLVKKALDEGGGGGGGGVHFLQEGVQFSSVIIWGG